MHAITSLEFNYFSAYVTEVYNMPYRQIQSDLMEWRDKGYTHPYIKCNKKREILEKYWVELAMRIMGAYEPPYTECDIQDDITPVEYEVIECENGAVIDPVSEVIIRQESAPVEDVITHVIVPFTRRYNNCVSFKAEFQHVANLPGLERVLITLGDEDAVDVQEMPACGLSTIMRYAVGKTYTERTYTYRNPEDAVRHIALLRQDELTQLPDLGKMVTFVNW